MNCYRLAVSELNGRGPWIWRRRGDNCSGVEGLISTKVGVLIQAPILTGEQETLFVKQFDFKLIFGWSRYKDKAVKVAEEFRRSQLELDGFLESDFP
jgi:hypothetical protein